MEDSPGFSIFASGQSVNPDDSRGQEEGIRSWTSAGSEKIAGLEAGKEADLPGRSG